MTSHHRFLPRIAVGVCAAIFLGASACRTSSQDATDAEPRANALQLGPAVAVDQPTHDFGRVTEGDKISHVFTIRNGGDAPLVVESVKTSCGCTAAVIKDKTVPPGGRTEVRLTVDTTNRTGQQHKTADVLTNDPKTPRARLEIQADVVPQLAFDQPFVRLTGRRGETTRLKAWLVGTLAPTAKPKIDDQTGDAEVTAAIVEEVAGDGVKRGVELTLKNEHVGRGRGVVHVSTGVEARSKLQLRFSFDTTGNIVAPQQVYLNAARENLRERVFDVRSQEAGFVLREARVVEGPFSTAVKPTESGYQVTVTARAAPPQKGVVRGKLLLVSNDRFEPQKEVRLTLGSSPAPRSGAPR